MSNFNLDYAAKFLSSLGDVAVLAPTVEFGYKKLQWDQIIDKMSREELSAILYTVDHKKELTKLFISLFKHIIYRIRKCSSTLRVALGSDGSMLRFINDESIRRYAAHVAQIVNVLLNLLKADCFETFIQDDCLKLFCKDIADILCAKNSESNGVQELTKIAEQLLLGLVPLDAKQLDIAVETTLVLSLVKMDGSLTALKQVTQKLAALKYCLKLITGLKILDSESSKQSALLAFVDSSNNSVMSVIDVLTSTIYGIVGNEPDIDAIRWMDEQMKDIMIPTGVVSVSQIIWIVAEIRNCIKDELLNLLPGYGSDVLKLLYAQTIRDDITFTQQALPSSFLDASMNPHFGRALEFAIEGCIRTGGFINEVSDNGLFKIHTKSARLFLKKCDLILEYVLLLIHMTAGQPPRATEIYSLRLKSSLEGRRNIFYLHNRISVIVAHSKTNSLTGSEKVIPRFLDSEMSKFVLLYLVVVMPLRKLAIKQLLDNDNLVSQVNTNMFVFTNQKKQGSVDATQYRQLFVSRLSKIITFDPNLNISIRFWRYISILITNKNRYDWFQSEHDDEMDEDDVLENEFLTDLQRGHTTRTVFSCYQRSTFNLKSLNMQATWAFFQASLKWHQILGIEQSGNDIELDVEATDTECDRPVYSDNASVTEQDINDDSDAVIANALRKFTGSADASYRHPEQRRVLKSLLNDAPNMLIIWPTGFGKTSCFVVPQLLYMAQFKTLVVVPFVALIEDQVMKSNSLNLRAVIWSPANTYACEQADLVYTSIENFELAKFRTWIGMMQRSETKRFVRIVIDEEHCFVLDHEWRPSVKLLPEAKNSAFQLLSLLLLFHLRMNLRSQNFSTAHLKRRDSLQSEKTSNFASQSQQMRLMRNMNFLNRLNMRCRTE